MNEWLLLQTYMLSLSSCPWSPPLERGAFSGTSQLQLLWTFASWLVQACLSHTVLIHSSHSACPIVDTQDISGIKENI